MLGFPSTSDVIHSEWDYSVGFSSYDGEAAEVFFCLVGKKKKGPRPTVTSVRRGSSGRLVFIGGDVARAILSFETQGKCRVGKFISLEKLETTIL